MRHAVASLIVISWLSGTLDVSAGGQAPPSPPANQAGPSSGAGVRYPKFELLGQLNDTFTVGKCEYISGMTCKIKYTGSQPLPSRVYFVEFDEAGNQAGAEVRLLYPRLEPGETGAATFSTRLSSPTRVRLRGEWKGPWQNPY